MVEYALTLFVFLPFVMGISSTVLYGYKNTVNRKQLRGNAFLTLVIFCVGLLFFAVEGIICIIMAAPIGLLFVWIGYLIASNVILKRTAAQSYSIIILLYISTPTLLAFENTSKHTDEVRSIVTSVEINASPQIVWKNVVTFPPIAEPTELLFKTGIAYPQNATIKGYGIGAVRYCNFNTGSFVEPITTWHENQLLAFSVAEQPVPMKEISPYNIEPNHLHGYWVSKKGQFKLTALPNGHTLLEGTTWYVNKIKPHFYWTIWSDNIVHAIHNRVLNHIKKVSEHPAQP